MSGLRGLQLKVGDLGFRASAWASASRTNCFRENVKVQPCHTCMQG